MKIKQLGHGVIEWTLATGKKLIDEPYRVPKQRPVGIKGTGVHFTETPPAPPQPPAPRATVLTARGVSDRSSVCGEPHFSATKAPFRAWGLLLSRFVPGHSTVKPAWVNESPM